MNEKKTLLERGHEIARNEGFTSIDERSMRAIERALEEGSLWERSLMACGHPRACGAASSGCQVCAELDGLQGILLRARGGVICRDVSGVLSLLDEALAKLFRPIAIKGEPASESILEERR